MCGIYLAATVASPSLSRFHRLFRNACKLPNKLPCSSASAFFALTHGPALWTTPISPRTTYRAKIPIKALLVSGVSVCHVCRHAVCTRNSPTAHPMAEPNEPKFHASRSRHAAPNPFSRACGIFLPLWPALSCTNQRVQGTTPQQTASQWPGSAEGERMIRASI